MKRTYREGADMFVGTLKIMTAVAFWLLVIFFLVTLLAG